MNTRTFAQSIIYFILLVISIVIFKLLNLEVNFIITFIFTIFTLSISIFFFTESNKILSIIRERLTGIKESMDKRWHDEEKVKDLNISNVLNYRSWERKK